MHGIFQEYLNHLYSTTPEYVRTREIRKSNFICCSKITTLDWTSYLLRISLEARPSTAKETCTRRYKIQHSCNCSVTVSKVRMVEIAQRRTLHRLTSSPEESGCPLRIQKQGLCSSSNITLHKGARPSQPEGNIDARGRTSSDRNPEGAGLFAA